MDAASIPVIVGATAAGKSAIALWLAGEGNDITIVSADSRQVYRRFDVGTAKPTSEERTAVPHVGIDVANPTERYSAYRWAELATDAIDTAHGEGRRPVVVGGTGLYVRTLFGTGFIEPEVEPERRDAMRHELSTLTTDALRRWCERLDPRRAALGRVQLLRSVEIALLTGHRLSELHATHQRAPRWRARYLVVDPGPVLAQRIADRARAMLGGAWQREVQQLLQGVPHDAPAWQSSGYGAVRMLVEGSATLEATMNRVVIETRQYAKRQRTWFRNQLPAGQVTWVDSADDGWRNTVGRWWMDGEEATHA